MRRGSVETGVRILHPSEYPDALAICATDPVGSVLAATRIEAAISSGRRGGEVWAVGEGQAEAICWSGANLVPVAADDAAVRAFARFARRRGRRCSSITGPARAVLGLWDELAAYWSPARQVRADQPSMALDAEPLLASDPELEQVLGRDFGLLLPACVRMFTEEVGYSPMSGGHGYRLRVRELINSGRMFARFAQGRTRVLFKGEFGAVAQGVAQLQGIWVDPTYRRRGIAGPCVAGMVRHGLDRIAPTVSLYVNSYNTAAIQLYRKVGFHQVGTYATVLF